MDATNGGAKIKAESVRFANILQTNIIRKLPLHNGVLSPQIQPMRLKRHFLRNQAIVYQWKPTQNMRLATTENYLISFLHWS